MTHTSTTVVTDEAQALAALGTFVAFALVARHPQELTYKTCNFAADWADGDEDLRRLCPGGDRAVLHVRLFDRGDIAAWSAALGVKAVIEHTIHAYANGRWCAVWTEVIQVRGWLPGVRLSVTHTEDRWVARP